MDKINSEPDYKLTGIFVYPIKSMGGISLKCSELTDRGLKYDRRWMLIDENNRFLSQRELHKLSLFKLSISGDGLNIEYSGSSNEILVMPPSIESGNKISARIWNDEVICLHYNSVADKWFSDLLNKKCRLVYMPDKSKRRVDPSYAANNEITSLSDGYPVLLIGEASLNLLNSRLIEKVPMDRFRPNLVFSGGDPHDEDKWKDFRIGAVRFRAVKPCDRCVVVTIDQEKGTKSKEPLKTLASYRTVDNKVLFGQNILHKGEGEVCQGDEIIVD